MGKQNKNKRKKTYHYSLHEILKKTHSDHKTLQKGKECSHIEPIQNLIQISEIQISLSDACNKRGIISLKKVETVSQTSTKVLISRKASIIKTIADAEKRMIERHRRGEIDLSGDSF